MSYLTAIIYFLGIAIIGWRCGILYAALDALLLILLELIKIRYLLGG